MKVCSKASSLHLGGGGGAHTPNFGKYVPRQSEKWMGGSGASSSMKMPGSGASLCVKVGVSGTDFVRRVYSLDGTLASR